MLVRKTKNTMYDIKKLRNIFNTNNNSISFLNERVHLLQKFISKVKKRNRLVKALTLFTHSYRLESIKLCKHEIEEAQAKIENLELNFEEAVGPTSHLVDKLKTLYNQLKKMKVFYFLDKEYYNYNQIDINDFSKHNFSFYKKDNKIYLEEDLFYYEFNSLFIGMYDDTKKNKLLELFSYDNVSISSKIVYFYSKTKRNGFNLKLETWLYHNPDGSKDETAIGNYPIYVYSLKFVKISFKATTGLKEYVFLGSDVEKMTFFHNLLDEYLLNLGNTYYDISMKKELMNLPQKKLLELFKKDQTYSWIIFDILLKNTELKTINITQIYKYYNLCYTDLINITMILKRYGFIEVSLGLEYIPNYKLNEVNLMYEEYLLTFKESLFKGELNG